MTRRQIAIAAAAAALTIPHASQAQTSPPESGRASALPGMILRLDPRLGPGRTTPLLPKADAPVIGAPIPLRLTTGLRKPPPQGQAAIAAQSRQDPIMATLFGAVMFLFLMPFAVLALRLIRLRRSRREKLVLTQPSATAYVDSFREHLEAVFGKPLRARCMELQRAEGYLHESGFYILGHRHPGQAPQVGFTGIGLVASGAATLPDRFTYGAEIYAAGSLRLGSKAVVGAILAEDDLRLGPDASVLRWAHANSIRTEPRALLRGRATADTLLQVDAGCQFEHLEAGRIEFGPHGRRDGHDGETSRRGRTHGARAQARGRSDEPTVHRAMVALLEDQTTGRAAGGTAAPNAADLPVVSAFDTTEIAAGTHLKINVTAPRLLLIRTGAVLGSPRQPVFVSAPTIRVEPGVVVFGTIWAREGGVVLGL